MDLDPTQLTAAVLRLPPGERARLAEVLLTSLEGEDASWEAEWLAEAERRDRAADADPRRVRSAAAVLDAVRAELETPSRRGR